MSCIPIEPRVAGRMPDCAWCGLRKSAGLFQASECCNECREGGRVFRVKMACQRWKRLQQNRVVTDE